MRWFLSSLILFAAVGVYYSGPILSVESFNIAPRLTLGRLLDIARSPSLVFQALRANSPQATSQTRTITMSVPRTIRQAFLAVEQSEGVGARVRRSIGTPKLRNLSPFLMLDHFSSSTGAGFPDHPHRGQETITYLLKGAFDHEDFTGNKGTIETGDLQFMTAGKGIVHAEMPHQNPDGSANVGLQLWVDLPEKLKMVDPRYRDLRAAEIPSVDVDEDRVHIKVISGQSHGVNSVRDLAYTPVWILDVTIKPGGKVQQTLPEGWNGFAYMLSGTTTFGSGKDEMTVGQYHNVVFNQEGDLVVARVDKGAKEDGRFGKLSTVLPHIAPLEGSTPN